jgi:adenine-specific DNA-methyltransferase
MGSLPVADDVLADVADAYRTRTTEALDGDAVVARTRDQWAAFVRTTQGDVFTEFEATDPEAAVDAAFRDTLYVDFLVDSLLDAVESRTGVTLANRNPGANTDVDFDLGACHDRILPPADGRERLAASVTGADLRAFGPDDLWAWYQSVVDRKRRLALGEYYTPQGIAELAVAELGPGADDRVLDPGCGAGVFLTACLDRVHQRGDDTDREPAAVLDRCTSAVVGFDLNPVAVKAAKLVYLCRLFEDLSTSDRDRIAVPVFLTDSLALAGDPEIAFRGEPLDLDFDSLVGNPPWIPWQRVPEPVKDGLQERYVEELGLQPHRGMDALLGHSNDDLAVPFVWVCIHRYLRSGGDAAFVLKRDSMRGPAGAVLRRLAVGDRSLALARVHDFGAVDPFPEVGANAAVYTFRADADHSFPIPTTVWTAAAGTRPQYGSLAAMRESLTTRETELRPLDPGDPTSAWVSADAERGALGECRHDIRHGLKDDANDVFGLDRATLDDVESALVYPYIRSRHVRKYGLTGHDLRLVPMDAAGSDNETWLRETHPRTYEYLRGHRDELEGRSSSWLDDGAFYSVFGLGEYTWAPYKVVWCRLGFKPHFTVASTRSDPDLGEKLVIPGDHYMFIATDEAETAHALCALLNSAPYQRTLRDITSEGKASLSKAVVSELALPDPADIEHRSRLAELSREAHDTVTDIVHEGIDAKTDSERRLEALQAEIDRLVADSLAGQADSG